MIGCVNYRDSGNQDDSWLSHLSSCVNNGAINSKGKYGHFIFNFEQVKIIILLFIPKFQISMKELDRNIY